MNESKRWLDCQIIPLLNGSYALYCTDSFSADALKFTFYSTLTEAEQARDLWLIKQKL
jgi:hypothetical protein